MEAIRNLIETKITEVKLSIPGGPMNNLPEEENRLVNQALKDFLHSVLLYVDLKDVLHILTKIHEAPTFMDLVPKLVETSEV